jgi:hypothetical protein
MIELVPVRTPHDTEFFMQPFIRHRSPTIFVVVLFRPSPSFALVADGWGPQLNASGQDNCDKSEYFIRTMHFDILDLICGQELSFSVTAVPKIDSMTFDCR